MNLAEIDAEEARLESAASTQASDYHQRGLLEGFDMANVKINLLSGNLEKLLLKKKYKNLFDIGVMSVNSANNIKRELSVLFKDQAAVHCESADYMIILK